ncbi:MAG: hypothetical protein JWP12_668 [Bacteroidetes bacterium]|nr:hypothetical protein [Bacteroidota bacterium]
MGKIVSAIGGTVDDVVSQISSAVTDVAKTAAQLEGMVTTISNQMSPPAGLHVAGYPQAHYHALKSSGRMVNYDQENIGKTITDARAAMAKSATSNFTKIFKDLEGDDDDLTINSDSGLVQNYCNDALQGLPQLTTQIQQNFDTWQIPSTTQVINNMATTIANEIVEKAGGPSFSHGVYSLTNSQTLYWVVSYGVFDVSVQPTTQALVYAFAVALVMDIE